MQNQKITPFLWFDRNAEEAIGFYTSVFGRCFDGTLGESKIESITRYPEGPLEGPMQGMEGKVLTAVFTLLGQRFMALDGGPHFSFTPAVSLFVTCRTKEEAEQLFKELSLGGSILMPMQQYPFSERYGWCNDKYGLSWQVNVGVSRETITPSFMFVGDNFGRAEEAINFYTSIFKHSSIEAISRYEEGEGDEVGKVKYSLLLLEGQQFRAMESSLQHKFTATGAISLYIECGDQAEVDYYWEKLSAGGNPAAQQCGWLQDKYGFSWQVIPEALPRLLNDPDKEKSGRVMQAMLQMKKIDIAGLEQAYEG